MSAGAAYSSGPWEDCNWPGKKGFYDANGSRISFRIRADRQLVAAAPQLAEALKDARRYVVGHSLPNDVLAISADDTLARIDAALKAAGIEAPS